MKTKDITDPKVYFGVAVLRSIDLLCYNASELSNTSMLYYDHKSFPCSIRYSVQFTDHKVTKMNEISGFLILSQPSSSSMEEECVVDFVISTGGGSRG